MADADPGLQHIAHSETRHRYAGGSLEQLTCRGGGSMHRLSVMIAVVCAVAGLARTGAAQGYQGGIRGAVHDAAGVVPGAEVTAINEETNVSRSTTTNEAGEYNLPN